MLYFFFTLNIWLLDWTEPRTWVAQYAHDLPTVNMKGDIIQDLTSPSFPVGG